MKKLACLLALLVFASTAFADVPRPQNSPVKKAKEIDSRLYIKLDKDAKEARLVVPRSMVKELRAALDEADAGDSSAMASTSGINGGFGSTQTVIAGLFMSLAMVFGGAWFMRKKQANNAKIAAVLAFLCLSASTTVILANMGPPLEARSITSKLFDKKVFQYYGFASGNIKVVISDEVDNKDTVELHVPRVEDAKPNGE